jgi:NAD(P)-dependent dehydrogenase (short-subunit alcohol dehydrogenase family)
MVMPTDLSGRHVVITGGRGGLGPAVVEAFAAAGAVCHLPERSSSPAPAPSAHVIPGVDLASEAAVEALYAGLPVLWASIHLAGGYAGGPFVQTSLTALRQQLDINLTTAFLCCREAMRKMGNVGGRIVNVASRTALVPAGGALAYAMSKAAVVALTHCLAEEARPQNILVNAVAPSTMDTPANRAAMPGADHARWTQPAEVARAILWLASPENTATSGAVVPVYGNA